ncbi:response regulator [Sphingomonas sp. JC676]|uniref:response regulator n=1 Tax=Sphingomonas sp. JC676 TaxID=2768065 RepID=UPI001657D08D|nr:response regulator [Sphingomonas sp. JC676]MBC9030820.1 response regulator [Sphingomonas sp. JC676]
MSPNPDAILTEAETTVAGQVPPAVAGPDIDRPRVLVVDDDERNLLAITTVIEDVAEVVVANSGEEALRQLLKHEFAVILLDVYMPGIDGYETAGLIRAREQTKRVPIIFLSAVNKETEHLLHGYAMGAVDYVFKPVEPAVLRSKVAVFVDLFTMTKEIQRKALQEQRLLDANLRANAERLQVEQKLRLAEQRQAAIIESLPIILYLEDLTAEPRVPKYVSGAFETMTGFSFEAVQTSPDLWATRLHPDDRDRVVRSLAERRAGRSLSVEYRWQCADGAYRHFLDQAVIVQDSAGNPVELAGTLLDVSERRELEDQLNQIRKMDAIGQLTGGIAHDFNNLLAAVLGGLGLLERRVPLDEANRKVLEMARHAADQGAELVKHLLAFSRRQKLEPAPVDIADLAISVSNLLSHTLGGLVELSWHCDPGIGKAYADAAQLELALMNLIINARDAMPEGGAVSVHAADRHVTEVEPDGGLRSGDYVVLTVADTGCGIAPELLDQVLEPFFTTKAIGKGTGLGLSMVYGFAQQSGGAMRIRSEVGVGSQVELWLPVAPVDEKPPQAPVSPATVDGAEAPAVRMRILLVDDHDAVRATTAAMLEDLGHSVAQANDGSIALEMVTQAPFEFDLILSDYAMPRLSGAELIRQLRDIRPGLRAVIITGYAEPDAALMRGLDAPVLTKPFTPGQLMALLTKAAAS